MPQGHTRHKTSFAPNFLTALYTGVSWAPGTWCQPSCQGQLPHCAKQWHQGAGKSRKHSAGFLRCHTNRSSPIQSMPSCLGPVVQLRVIYVGGKQTDIRHTKKILNTALHLSAVKTVLRSQCDMALPAHPQLKSMKYLALARSLISDPEDYE